MSTSSNKRLAFNTAILYGKLIISTIISFVVSRLVLKALGASDYGLYNVVGGIVALLNTLGVTMIATSYRFIAIEIGKGDNGNSNKIFNTVFVIHIIFAVFLLIIGETAGVFYIKHYLNVEASRIPDALFVLHLSLLTSAFSVLSIPANGLLIAREKFLFTALVEIIGAIIKLGFVLLIIYMDGNKLRYYACFLSVIQLLTPITYQLYCWITDRNIVKWAFNNVTQDYKAVVKFASGIILGAVASMARVQGSAIIINIFFGTVLNAAFALATQVWTASDQLTNSLRQAAVPQIMKSHASGDERHSLELVYLISRYSFLLMLLPAVPFIVGIDGVLKIWLGTVPEYTDSFIVFLMLSGLINSLCAGFDAKIQATGKIWKNQIGYSIINLLLLPIMFLMYKVGMPPYSNAVAMVMISFIIVVFQAYIMKELTDFNIKRYFSDNVISCARTALISFIPLLIFRFLLKEQVAESIWIAFVSSIWTTIVVFFVGIKKGERNMIIAFAKKHMKI